MAPAQEAAFVRECASVRAIGDVSRLSGRMEGDIQKILELAGAEDSTGNEEKIRKLVDDVTGCADSIKRLIDPHWAVAKWQTQQEWEFGPNDLTLMGAGCDVSEKKFTGFEVIQVYFAGAPHPELVSEVKGQLEGHKVHFSLALPQSTLSLCELQNVTGVQIRLNVNLCGQADWREFRLSLRNS
jgi:hypothetical protein